MDASSAPLGNFEELTLEEVRAELLARSTREAHPVDSGLFFVVGPGARIFRCEKAPAR